MAPIVGVSSTVIVDTADVDVAMDTVDAVVPLGFGDMSFLEFRRGDMNRRTPFFFVGVERSAEDDSDMEADDEAPSTGQ